MSSFNCGFLTCIQSSQEADQVVWYSNLFQNFPQFIVIHTVKGFGIVNKAEIVVFLELSCFFHDTGVVGNLISGSSAFSKTSLNIRSQVRVQHSFGGHLREVRWTTILARERTLKAVTKEKPVLFSGVRVRSQFTYC